MKCWKCGTKQIENRGWFCQNPKCTINLYAYEQQDNKERQALTEYQRMKLGWYRNEKTWIDNIHRRKIVTKNGQRAVVLTDEKGNIQSRMPDPRDR